MSLLIDSGHHTISPGSQIFDNSLQRRSPGSHSKESIHVTRTSPTRQLPMKSIQQSGPGLLSTPQANDFFLSCRSKKNNFRKRFSHGGDRTRGVTLYSWPCESCLASSKSCQSRLLPVLFFFLYHWALGALLRDSA